MGRKKADWGSFTPYDEYKQMPDLYFSPTDLLRFAEVPWTPGPMIDLLVEAGLIEAYTRPSTTRPGVIRTNYRWADSALEYGANVKTRAQDDSSELRFRASRFHDVLKIAAEQLLKTIARSAANREAALNAMDQVWYESHGVAGFDPRTVQLPR